MKDIYFILLIFCSRPPSLSLLTIGQIQAEYHLHKNPGQVRGKEPALSERCILVSGPNAQIPEGERRLPHHIEFSDGTVMKLVNDGKQRVIDSKKHKDEHSKMYADMFLYLPWQDEEEFLGEARISEVACEALWDEFGEMALDLKEQLRLMIRNSRLA